MWGQKRCTAVRADRIVRFGAVNKNGVHIKEQRDGIETKWCKWQFDHHCIMVHLLAALEDSIKCPKMHQLLQTNNQAGSGKLCADFVAHVAR